MGSKNIQKISKAVATGLSSSSQPSSAQFLHATNANAMIASGPRTKDCKVKLKVERFNFRKVLREMPNLMLDARSG